MNHLVVLLLGGLIITLFALLDGVVRIQVFSVHILDEVKQGFVKSITRLLVYLRFSVVGILSAASRIIKSFHKFFVVEGILEEVIGLFFFHIPRGNFQSEFPELQAVQDVFMETKENLGKLVVVGIALFKLPV
jgi:hypothetical protein